MQYPSGASQSVSGAYDTIGNFFPLDSLPQHFERDGSGNVLSITVTDGKSTWTQTYTYVNGFVSDISGWVKA
jgi:hypothetical protein